jgi:pSer/pThr/pTyr-binding forkhead associated (FHA) protein
MPPIGLPLTGASVYDAEIARTPHTIPAVPVRSGVSFILQVTQGPASGQKAALERFPFRIGRGPEADLSFEEDMSVSRSHAEIYEWAGALHIRDMGSTHGTQVNGMPVTDYPLHPGDRINVGGTTIMLREKL